MGCNGGVGSVVGVTWGVGGAEGVGGVRDGVGVAKTHRWAQETAGPDPAPRIYGAPVPHPSPQAQRHQPRRSPHRSIGPRLHSSGSGAQVPPPLPQPHRSMGHPPPHLQPHSSAGPPAPPICGSRFRGLYRQPLPLPPPKPRPRPAPSGSGPAHCGSCGPRPSSPWQRAGRAEPYWAGGATGHGGSYGVWGGLGGGPIGHRECYRVWGRPIGHGGAREGATGSGGSV